MQQGPRVRLTLLYSVYAHPHDRDEDFIPDSNTDYKRHEYWERRFSKEPTYEWLGSFEDCRGGMEATGVDFNIQRSSALIVGCGNSLFSRDVSARCPSWRIVSVDFSRNVIENMKRRFPDLEWVVDDMTTLESFQEECFDIVLDKAAMDALVADEGSSWDPSESSKLSVYNMLKSCARVLKSGGKLSIVSFQPVHFRRAHLERAIDAIAQDEEKFRWRRDIHVKTSCYNVSLGTEFAVFTLTKE